MRFEPGDCTELQNILHMSFKIIMSADNLIHSKAFCLEQKKEGKRRSKTVVII